MKWVNSVLFVFCASYGLSHAYDWPIAQDTVQHVLISVMGECRHSRVGGVIVDSIHHFHRGIDMNAPCSTAVYAIEGDTCYISGSGINIGHFRYYHLAGFIYSDSSFVPENAYFAKTDAENHVHLQEADTVLRQAGDVNDVNWLNPLRTDGINPFEDSASTAYPVIRDDLAGIKLWRQGTNDTISRDSVIDGRVDITVNARDPWTDSLGRGMGGGASGNMGVYENYGYIFADIDTTRQDTLRDFEYHRYDYCPNNINVEYAYAPGSYNSQHIYFITNNPFDTLNPQDYYWNTKQRMEQADSVDADSIEDAKFKDGHFWVKAHIYDIKGNTDTESLLVHVDNFNPKVKETRPSDWFAFVPTNEKRVWCIFSEAMDTMTLDTLNIKMQSLKSDSHPYTITDIRYVQIDSLDTFKLYLEVDSFRFKDTVQVRLLDGVKDLAGKSVDHGSKQDSIAYSWTFVVGVMQLTDNDLNDLYPDVYHEKIVWTQAASGSDLGEIVLYDFYSNDADTISPGGGIHTLPYIYEDEVAWIGWQDTVAEYVYYYDGTGSIQIALANRGRSSMEISGGGVVWRSYRSAGSGLDSIWVEYYIPDSNDVYVLDSFMDFQYLGRGRGRVDIDASEISWDRRCYPGSDHEVYKYNGGLSNFSNDPDTSDLMPNICDGQILWEKAVGGYNGYGFLWFYDGENKRKLDSTQGPAEYPYLHNGSMIWIDEPSTSNKRLVFYDGRQVEQLMLRQQGSSFYAYESPTLHNNQVAWLRFVYQTLQWPFVGYYNASFYDGENVVALTADTLGQGHSMRIEVHDGFVVYDAWDGNDYEIYLYIGDTLFTPPALTRDVRNEILVIADNGKQDDRTITEATSKSRQKTKDIDDADTQTRQDTQVRLLWSPNTEPDLAGYNIYRSETAYTYDTIPYGTVSDSDTIFLDTLPMVSKNYYVVTAYDDLNNESGFSNQTLADLTPDTIPPSAPCSLAAVCNSPYNAVDLTWSGVFEPDLGMYRIYRADSTGGYSTPLDSVANSVTEYTDTTVLQGMIYYYVVTAVDTIGNESTYSNEVSVLVPDTIPPSVPANLVAAYDTIYKAVDLSWNASLEPDLSLYRIYRSETSGNYTIPLDSVEEPDTTFIDLTILFDTTYYYVVTAVDTNLNESAYSNEATVVVPDTTPPFPPTNFVCNYDSISQIVSLNWTAPSDPDVELYRVYRSEISGTYSTPLDSVCAPTTNYADSSMMLGKYYYYVVTAVDDANNESNYSDEDTVAIPVWLMSYSALASAYNNGRRIVYNSSTEELFLSYAKSDVMALGALTSDGGATWLRSAYIGPGSFPTMALDSDTNLHCVFRGITDTDLSGRVTGGEFDGQKNGADQYAILSEANGSIVTDEEPIASFSTTHFALDYRTSYAVGHAIYDNGVWQNTSLYETQDSILSVSFAIDPLDTGWVVFNTYASGTNSLKIGKFYTQNFPTTLQNDTTLDTYSSLGVASMIVKSFDRSIWIVYERDGTIVCKYRKNNGTWSTAVVQQLGVYPTLSLAQAGDFVHFIWEKYSHETETREIQTCYTRNGRIWTAPQKIADVANESCYPFIEKGSIAVWHDLNYSYWDIYASQRDESDTWTTPENISSTSNDSRHPQVALYQTLSQTHLMFCWTEGSQSPYEVRLDTDSLISEALPLYVFNFGDEVPSLISTRRHGSVKYGNGYAKTVDYDTECLQYELGGLDHEKVYKLKLVFYQNETDEPWEQTVDIDGNFIKQLALSRDDVLITEIVLAPEEHKDGEITVRISRVRGPKVVLSAMSVWEYEKESRVAYSGGPQSSGDEILGSIFFSGIYPNPGKDDTKIRFNATHPREVSIRLYDVSGRMVNELYKGEIMGVCEIPLKCERLASGIYFVRVVAGNDTITEKVILLR